MSTRLHYRIRRWHRYLGFLLGLQFMAWTVGGLYFSWTKIDEVRGENLRKKPTLLAAASTYVAPSVPLAEMQKVEKIDSVISIQIVDILGAPYYQLTYKAESGKKTQLANALTGMLRPPLSKEEAMDVAKLSFKDSCKVVAVEYLTSTNGHHEYREKPLPAYAVKLEHPTHTTVYVSAELGTVQTYRNDSWRIFDFLWMLHVMDFENRDDINNWLLRAFSIFGIVTLLSGYVLFFVSFKRKKKSSF